MGRELVKPREPRRKVMIKARMRAGASWSDAFILNMSSKGLLVRSHRSPSRGSYLEIRRGSYVIVAHVVWANSDRFGVRTQDPVPADGLIRDPDGASAVARPAASHFQERRAAPRPQVRHERSRQTARVAEFAAMAFACLLVAVLIAVQVAEVVAKPLDAARTALSSN